MILPFQLLCSGRPSCGTRLDDAAAARFVRAHSAWLAAGLAGVDDPACRRRVLAVHDDTHEVWLSVIAALGRQQRERAASDTAALYVFSGRVAATIERGADPLLPPTVRVQLHGLLAHRLAQLTWAVTRHLVADGSLAGTAG